MNVMRANEGDSIVFTDDANTMNHRVSIPAGMQARIKRFTEDNTGISVRLMQSLQEDDSEINVTTVLITNETLEEKCKELNRFYRERFAVDLRDAIRDFAEEPEDTRVAALVDIEKTVGECDNFRNEDIELLARIIRDCTDVARNTGDQ